MIEQAFLYLMALLFLFVIVVVIGVVSLFWVVVDFVFKPIVDRIGICK